MFNHPHRLSCGLARPIEKRKHDKKAAQALSPDEIQRRLKKQAETFERQRDRAHKREAIARKNRFADRMKNQKAMDAMGLSSNVFEWPGQHMPKWAVAKLHRNRTPGVIDPEINRTYRDY